MKRGNTEELVRDEEVVERVAVPEEEEDTLSESQHEAMALVRRGHSVFITGSAGSGKSFLLARLVRELRERGRRHTVTASTGVAAWNIDGTTLHAFAGIGLGNESVEQALTMLRRPQARAKLEAWRAVQVLIIDEISMIAPDFLAKLDALAQRVRNSAQPFGGIQLVMSGDFLQCPPILARAEPTQPRFLFEAPVWDDLRVNCIALRENFRQAGDRTFFALLERVRQGRPTDEDAATLRSRLLARHPQVDERDLIKLCAHRETAERYNAEAMARIAGDARHFEAIACRYDERGAATRVHEEEKRTPVPVRLALKEGAQVLLCVQMDQANGLFNGSRGTIVGFRQADDLPDTTAYPVVQFDNGVRRLITPHTWNAYNLKRREASYTQVPLLLRYAMTIHKAQGLTLGAILLDGAFFDCGMAYVAMSRVCSLADLFLRELDMRKVRAAEEVIAFYETKHLL